MVKVIEATALINAKTGDISGFSAIANKFALMNQTSQTVARSTARAAADMGRKIGEVTKAMSVRFEDLGRKDRAIDNLTRSMGRLAETRTAFRDAETHVRSLAREMAASTEPSRQMARNYEQAQRQVRSASAAFNESRNAAVAAKRAMVDLGLPLTGLGRQQAELRERIRGTTLAMQQQGRTAPHLRSSLATATPAGGPVTPRPGVGHPGSGLPEAAASIGILGAVRDTVTAGMNVDTERSQARQAGWTDKEIETLEHRANRFSAQYGVAPATSMNIIREARPTFGGDLQQTLQNVPDFFKVLTAMRQKSPQASESEHAHQLGMMIKAGEILGYSSDPAKLSSYANTMTQMTQVHGSALRGEEILNFAKSGKSAAAAASPEFLKSILPTMLPELGGDRLGTAMMTLRQVLVGGKMKKAAAENMVDLGLVDPDSVIYTSTGNVKGIKQGGIKGSKLAESNPLEWIKQHLVPALKEKEVDQDDWPAKLSTLFSDRNAEYMVNLMLTQMARLEKDRATVEKAKGLPGVEQALKDDPYLAAARVKGGLQNVGAALSDPVMEPLKKAADGAAGALNSAADAAREQPKATGAGLAAGAALGGGVAGYLSQGAGTLLRLGGIAAGVGGGAAAGGLVLPFIAQGAASYAGGAMGEVGSIAAGKHFIAKDREGFTDLRTQLAEIESRIRNVESRVHPSMRDMPNADLDRMRGQAQDLRNRIDLSSRSMPWTDAAGAMGERGRGVVQSPGQIEAVVKPDQITAKLEGQAQLGVEVTVAPSADFIASVVKKVLSQVGHIGIDGSGPGSTGRSMPEAAAPNTGSSMGPR